MSKIGRLKTIKWRDSRMYITQCAIDDDFEVCVIISTGFVIKEDKKQIVLAGDIVDRDVRRVIVIPKENIL
jgi:hypothetical protein